jgi:hypothetical protein
MSPTRVRVYVPRRDVSTFFGGVVGRTTIPVGSSAQAKLGVTVNCALCFLGSVDAGNGDFTVTGGSVAVNGDVSSGSNSAWTASTIGVVGTFSGGTFTPAPTSIPSFGDPLASSLTLPLDTTGLTAKSDPCTDGPGLYGNVNFDKSTCPLSPGLYVISGTWGMKNKSLLKGTGVTLYVRSPSGYLDFKNGDVDIQAPAAGAATNKAKEGFAIIYDRDNTNNISLQGNGGTQITGIVYAPVSKLDFNGNSCFGFKAGPIIVNGVVKANGNKSCVTVTDAVDTTVKRLPQHLDR